MIIILRHYLNEVKCKLIRNNASEPIATVRAGDLAGQLSPRLDAPVLAFGTSHWCQVHAVMM
jgi:hypothetical protein